MGLSVLHRFHEIKLLKKFSNFPESSKVPYIMCKSRLIPFRGRLFTGTVLCVIIFISYKEEEISGELSVNKNEGDIVFNGNERYIK